MEIFLSTWASAESEPAESITVSAKGGDPSLKELSGVYTDNARTMLCFRGHMRQPVQAIPEGVAWWSAAEIPSN
jgi:hypothetical protein